MDTMRFTSTNGLEITVLLKNEEYEVEHDEASDVWTTSASERAVRRIALQCKAFDLNIFSEDEE